MCKGSEDKALTLNLEYSGELDHGKPFNPPSWLETVSIESILGTLASMSLKPFQAKWCRPSNVTKPQQEIQPTSFVDHSSFSQFSRPRHTFLYISWSI